MSVHPNAWKGVPIEDMRAWYAEYTEAESIRAVAERAEVRHSTLHNFLRGAMPHPRVRMRLAAHYLQGSGAGRAAEGALAVLLSGVPDDAQEEARRGLLDAVADVYRSAGGGAAPVGTPMKPLVFEIEAVRAYAQERAARASLREVARDADVGVTTLHNFVLGSTPHPRIRLKLAAWYARRVPEETGAMAARDAASVLLMGYPAEHYAEAVRALPDGVAELYLAVGAEPPPWTTSGLS